MSLISPKVAAMIEAFKPLIKTYNKLSGGDGFNSMMSFDSGNNVFNYYTRVTFYLILYVGYIQNIYDCILKEDENIKLTKELVEEILIAFGETEVDEVLLNIFWEIMSKHI